MFTPCRWLAVNLKTRLVPGGHSLTLPSGQGAVPQIKDVSDVRKYKMYVMSFL